MPLSLCAPTLLQLAPMQPPHVEGVMAIEAVSFGSYHWSSDAFLAELANGLGLYSVLLQGGTVLGYTGGWCVLDEGHITTVAVAPAQRGKAFGELLFTHLYTALQAMGSTTLTLEVRASNFNAQNLYYKYGFVQVGLRPKYYQDNGEDALLMTSPLLTSPEQEALFAQHTQALAQRLGVAYPLQGGLAGYGQPR